MEPIEESSLSRVKSWMDKHDCGFVSAYITSMTTKNLKKKQL